LFFKCVPMFHHKSKGKHSTSADLFAVMVLLNFYLHATDEYIDIYSSVPRNIDNYIRWRYIPRCFHRLTEEFTLYSLVIQLYSSVVIDKCFIVSCSDYLFLFFLH
jgi:hypothetical protein